MTKRFPERSVAPRMAIARIAVFQRCSDALCHANVTRMAEKRRERSACLVSRSAIRAGDCPAFKQQLG